jgi:hypothetical protein
MSEAVRAALAHFICFVLLPFDLFARLRQM